MKNIILFFVFSIAGYYFFVYNTFKREIHFQGDSYTHIDSKSGGDITNHYYSNNGESLTISNKAIQILELSEKYPKSDWVKELKPLLNQYSLKPISDNPVEMSGQFERGGLNFNTYSAAIYVDGREHLVLFINISEKNKSLGYSKTIELIQALKNIETDFN